jgi:hypothetical protein
VQQQQQRIAGVSPFADRVVDAAYAMPTRVPRYPRSIRVLQFQCSAKIESVARSLANSIAVVYKIRVILIQYL